MNADGRADNDLAGGAVFSVDYYYTKHNLYNVTLNLNNFHLF